MELIGKPRKGQMKVWTVARVEEYGGAPKAYAVKREAERVASRLKSVRAWVEVQELELSEVGL